MRVPIRIKVAGSLALPLAALFAVSAFEVRQAANDAADVRDETDLATALSGPSGVISSLQEERIWAGVALTGLEEMASRGLTVTGYGPTRRATDEAIDAFREDVESKGGLVEETFGSVLEDLDALQDIRLDIDEDVAPPTPANMPFSSAMFDRYTTLIEGMIEANGRVSGQVRDGALRQGAELAVMATQLVELESSLLRETVVAATLSPGGVDTPAEITAISSGLSTFERISTAVLGTAGPFADVVQEHYPRPMADAIRSTVRRALDEGQIGDVASFVEGLIETMNERPENRFTGLRDPLIEAINDRAERLNADAVTRQRLFVVLSVVALLLAGTLTWLVSRSITRPMRSLTLQAREMADRRLPVAVQDILDTPPGEDVRIRPVDPVEVTTRDEVADVVRALNTVQESALDLAVEQAVLRRNIADSFVNLGRRNQNLLGRQLDFITELESNESDPDTLAGLFRLDHLATRMRRNAESLLVLAGVAPPRKWTAPVRITDVIRAALGEVEDYQRVRIEGVQPVAILGSAAADLAHLLAELVENSLTFSPPGEHVAIHGMRLGVDEGYRLTIVDQGLGMPPDAIEQANIRLAGSESRNVAPSKYLGHHVAGSLAARHGIRVRLASGQPRGIITTVDLPPSMSGAPAADPVARQDTQGQGRITSWDGALPAGVGAGAGAALGAGGDGSAGAGAGGGAGSAGLGIGRAGGGRSDGQWPSAFTPEPAALPSGASPAPAPAPSSPGSVTGWEAGPLDPFAPPGTGDGFAGAGAQPGAPGSLPRRRASAPQGTGGSLYESGPPAEQPSGRGGRMTAGGLPKRTRIAPTAVTPQTMPDDLLAALESHTRTIGRQPGPGRGHGRGDIAPAGPSWANPAPAAPAARSGPPDRPTPASPPPALPHRSTQPAPPFPAPRPGPGIPLSPGAPGAPAAPEEWGASPLPPGASPRPGQGPGASPVPPAPGGPSGPGGPGGLGGLGGLAPAHRPEAAPSGGGLPRRQRGAHLPTLQPKPLRRYQPASPPRGEDGPARANEVYSFLTGFSAGVQRGLDEMRGGDAPDQPAPAPGDSSPAPRPDDPGQARPR